MLPQRHHRTCERSKLPPRARTSCSPTRRATWMSRRNHASPVNVGGQHAFDLISMSSRQIHRGTLQNLQLPSKKALVSVDYGIDLKSSQEVTFPPLRRRESHALPFQRDNRFVRSDLPVGHELGYAPQFHQRTRRIIDTTLPRFLIIARCSYWRIRGPTAVRSRSGCSGGCSDSADRGDQSQ